PKIRGSTTNTHPACEEGPFITMATATTKNCGGCSACCLSVGRPPFLLELDNGIPRPVGGSDSNADYRRLLEAPAEAQAAYLRRDKLSGGNCSWLDTIGNRCSHYEFRPDLCRTFEVGGKWCSQLRELHQIG